MATIGELMLLWDIRDELKRANDLVEEERLRRSEEELRERLAKEWIPYFIHHLREGNYQPFTSLIEDGNKPIYSHISAEDEIRMIENGEVKLYVLMNKGFYMGRKDEGGIRLQFEYWTDETREEAKHPLYVKKLNKFKEIVAQDEAESKCRLLYML